MKKNIRYVVCPFIILFLLIQSQMLRAESEIENIVVFLRDGTLITAKEDDKRLVNQGRLFQNYDKYTRLKSLNIGGMTYDNNKILYKLDWNQMKKKLISIELLSPALKRYGNGKMMIQPQKGDIINTKSGSLLRYLGHDYAISEFVVYSYDGLNDDWREENLDIRKVKKIVFNYKTLLQSQSAGKKIKKESTQGSAQEQLNFVATADEITNSLINPKYGKSSANTVKLNIEFDFDAYTIRSKSFPILHELGKALTSKDMKGKTIFINGYTDSDGSKAYNLHLSRKRAKAVKTYLAANFKIPSNLLKTKGYGESRPLVPNTNNKNKQINRRVEVSIHPGPRS